MSNTWTVIVNLKASSGKCAKQWPRIKDFLDKYDLTYVVLETEYAGHAMKLARESVLQGARCLLAVGGDGTVNEVVNGLFTQQEVETTEVLVAQIPVGTGNDWRKTLGIPKGYEDAVKALAKGKTKLQDIGYVDFLGIDPESENRLKAGNDQGSPDESDSSGASEPTGKQPMRRYFANIGGMGFQAFAGTIINAQKARGKGGIMGYVQALITGLRKYKALPVRYLVDGVEKGNTDVFSIAVGICKYNGGGMKQCPDAIFDDGLLDLTVIHNLSKLKVLRNIPFLFTGSFVKRKQVLQFRGKEVRVESDDILLEVDGENIGGGTSVFGIEPLRLRVVVGE